MKYYLKALKNYANFSGRARRKEYWLFTLFHLILLTLLVIVDGGLTPEGGLGLWTAIYTFAVLVPALAVTARRLHDTGRSGWWMLLNLVPLFGAIVVFVFLVQDSNPGANKFGENPKGSVA
jgi:uncharacterized membrane protein YhaH (DUF805 family)